MSFTMTSPPLSPSGSYYLCWVPQGSTAGMVPSNALGGAYVFDCSCLALAAEIANTVKSPVGAYGAKSLDLLVSIAPGP
jgi:hypothetical protein